MENQLIIRPIITEKTMGLASKGQFVFRVGLHATKGQIAKDTEKIFKVNVLKVKTRVVKGKSHRSGKRRTVAVRSDWKKASVFLKKGQTIEAFALTSQEQKS